MTQTMTATAASNATIIILPPIKHKHPTAIERLTIIVDTYSHWRDALSIAMINWADKVFTDAKSIAENLILTSAIERIHILVNEILINPLNQSPLREPQLVGNQVLEKDVVMFCAAEGNKSPYDDSELNFRPHLFAKDMIEWVHSLPAEILPKEMAAEIALKANVAKNTAVQKAGGTAVVSTAAAEGNLILKMIKLQAQKVITLEKIQLKTQEFELATENLTNFNCALAEKVKEETEKFKKLAAAHSEALNAKVNQFESSQKKTADSFQSRLVGLKRQIEFLKSQLTSSNAVLSQQAAHIESLRQSNQNLHNQVQNMDTGGGCVIL